MQSTYEILNTAGNLVGAALSVANVDAFNTQLDFSGAAGTSDIIIEVSMDGVTWVQLDAWIGKADTDDSVRSGASLVPYNFLRAKTENNTGITVIATAKLRTIGQK